MPTATQNLVGVSADIVSPDDWIGSYFWYSIPTKMLSLARVRKAFKDAGLDPDLLPKVRRGEHVAMEACKSVERVTQNGHREEIHADFVGRVEDAQDGTVMIHQVTRHVQDKEHRVIEHPKALRVTYRFDTNTLSFEPLDGATQEDVQGLEDEIQAHFDGNASKLSGHNFRTILRHYVEAAGAENMRGQSGGVYFLPRRNEIPSRSKLYPHHGAVIDGNAFIASVRTALEAIYGRAPEWHRIPCINDEEQREFLKRKFIENCAEDLKTYRDECLELVRAKDQRTRGFRQDKRDNMVEMRREIDARRQKFAAILGETLEELDRDMQLADKALAKFLTEADA